MKQKVYQVMKIIVNIRKFMDITVKNSKDDEKEYEIIGKLGKDEINNNNNFEFDLRMDLNYKQTVGEQEDDINKETEFIKKR